MLTIKTWCLPEDLGEVKAKSLHEGIVKAVTNISGLGVESENDMRNLFPRDLMTYGLGTDILVEFTQVSLLGVREKLVNSVCSVIHDAFPNATIDWEILSPFSFFGRWSPPEPKEEATPKQQGLFDKPLY
jgi:hypothetical protein